VIGKETDKAGTCSASRWDEHRIRLLEKLFEEIKYLGKGDLVIVEGKSDRQSLRILGVSSKIVTKKELEGIGIVRGGPKTKRPRLILLPDFDKEGEENMRRWRKILERVGSVDDSIWRKLRHLTKGEVRDIESLPTLARKFRLIREEIWLDPDEEVS